MIKQEREILLSLKAKSQITEIFDYIKLQSRDNALKVRQKIKEAISILSIFPEAYPRDWFIDQTNCEIRFTIVYNFKIVFEVTENQIIVLQVFHAAQNPEKLSETDDEQ